MTRTKNHEIIALLLSGFFLFLWMRTAARLPYNETGVFYGHNYNFIAYLAGAVGTFLLYVLLSGLPKLLFSRLGIDDRKVFAPWFLDLMYLAVFLLMLFYMYKIYRDETIHFPGDVTASYLRQMMPYKPYYLFILLLAVLSLYAMGAQSNMRRRIVMIFLFSVINALMLFAPNFTADKGGGTQHIDAYTTTITNIAHLIPFSKTNMSIYGHYPLLYLPLVKLLGNNYTAIALSIALFALLTYAAVFCAASYFLKNDWLLFLAVSAITGTTTILNRRGQYYQINPHRLLFPALVLLYVAWLYSGRGLSAKTRRLLELLLGGLAILWNLETGLFSVVILIALHIYDLAQKKQFFSVKLLIELLIAAVQAVLSFALAFILVGIYNVAVGGSFGTVLDFIYPMFSGTYQVNNLRLPLPGPTALYVLELIVFVLSAVFFFVRQFSKDETGSAYDAMVFATSLSGCASIVYFLNRTALGNMSIQHIQMALLLALLCAPVIEGERTPLPQLLSQPPAFFALLSSFFFYVGLVWFAFEALITLPVCASNRAQATWNQAALNQMAAEIAQVVPKDTLAYGIGLPQMYQQLGWDTRCHTIDTLDMNDINREYRDQLIASENAVLTSSELDPETWEIQAQWTMPTGFVISYALRK